MERSWNKKREIGMRRSLAAIAALAVVLATAFALAGDMDANARALAKLDDEWSAVAATRDAAKVASFYTDDAVVYAPNEPVAVGRVAAQKVWAAYFAEPSYRISWKTTHAEVNGDLGFTSGAYEDSYKGADGKLVQGKGKYLCVWRKQKDGSWKAIHDMWNTDSR